MNNAKKGQRHAAKTKNNIYESAVRLFSEKGYTDVTVSEICAEAGIAVGVFYYYFPSKRSLLDQSSESLHAKIERETQALANADPIENIRELAKCICRRFISRGVMFMSVIFKNELDRRDYYKKSPRNMFGCIQAAVERAVRRGLLTGETDAIANDIWRSLRGATFEWMLKNGAIDLEEEASRAVDILLEHYAPKE